MEQRLGIALSFERFGLDMRPSELARLVDQAIAGGREVAGQKSNLYFVPYGCRDDPKEAAFRAGCADVAHVTTVRFPPWRELIAPDFGFAGLVDHIVAQIDRHAGPEPVRLVGNCLGGWVAYAAARKLTATGRSVTFLGLLDTDAAEALSGSWRIGLGVWLKEWYWAWHRRRLALRVVQVVTSFLARRPRLLRRLAGPALQAGLLLPVAVLFDRWLGATVPPGLDLDRWLGATVPSGLDRPGVAGMMREARAAGAFDVPTVLFRSEEHAADVPIDLEWASFRRRLTVVQGRAGTCRCWTHRTSPRSAGRSPLRSRQRPRPKQGQGRQAAPIPVARARTRAARRNKRHPRAPARALRTPSTCGSRSSGHARRPGRLGSRTAPPNVGARHLAYHEAMGE